MNVENNKIRGRALGQSSSIDSFRSDIDIHNDLIPARYSGETNSDADRRVRIPAFKRNMYVPSHSASSSNLANIMWLLKFGGQEQWYEKPEPSILAQMVALNSTGYQPEDLQALKDPRPMSLPVPQVWVSAALNTPMDDDIFDRTASHSTDGDFDGTCHRCTLRKCETLEKTPLVYTLVNTPISRTASHSTEGGFAGSSLNNPSHKFLENLQHDDLAVASMKPAMANRIKSALQKLRGMGRRLLPRTHVAKSALKFNERYVEVVHQGIGDRPDGYSDVTIAGIDTFMKAACGMVHISVLESMGRHYSDI